MNRKVVIPFAPYLAEHIPPVAVRLRRDFKSLLRLIEAHAILHQVTRERDEKGRIVATSADYEAVRELVADLVANGVGATVPDTMRATVQAVRQLDIAEGSTVRLIAHELKLDRSATQRRVQAARERGYLVNLEEKRGRMARYAIGEPLPEEVELLPRHVPVPGCAGNTVERKPSVGGNVQVSNVVREAVQVCSHNGEMYTDQSKPDSSLNTPATLDAEECIQLFEEG
jgi:hypothetical protein